MQLCGQRAKMILIKHGCHMPPYQAKITYIPIVKFGVPLVSVQLARV